MSNNSIIKKYTDIVDQLVKARPLPTLQERHNIIEQLNKSYLGEISNNLPNSLLLKLTDWYLADELRNRNKYKMEIEEYPILTEPQAKRRRKQVVCLEDDVVDYHDNCNRKPYYSPKSRVIRGHNND